eukprot:4773269-Lingulodinium_polyedra.AAC.1
MLVGARNSEAPRAPAGHEGHGSLSKNEEVSTRLARAGAGQNHDGLRLAALVVDLLCQTG